MAVYTSGRWKVFPGHEGAFIEAWNDFASKTKGDFPETTATLLRDRDDPTRFVSLGLWASLNQVEQWRASETFKTGVAAMRPLLAEFSAHTLDVAASA